LRTARLRHSQPRSRMSTTAWRAGSIKPCSTRSLPAAGSADQRLGPDRCTATQRRDLMEIVEDRAGSTLITSQRPVEAWHEVIGKPTFADAILHRIAHNAYRFALERTSMQKPEAAEADAPANGPDSATAISTKPTKAIRTARPPPWVNRDLPRAPPRQP
jgi:hypothetical protein